MIRRHTGPKRLILAALLTLAGCASFNIDESSVFIPIPFNERIAEERGEVIAYERLLNETEEWQVTFEIGGERAEVSSDLIAYAPTHIMHDKIPGRINAIAYSLISREGKDRPLIVHCGGNASTRQYAGFGYTVKALQSGDVFLFDYPGSGETGGRASSESFEAMSQDIADYLNATVDPDRTIVLWGHSLGGFVCSDLSKRLRRADGIILEASARNAREVANAWIPGLARPFINIDVAESIQAYDNAKALDRFEGPIMVLSGRRDTTLPVKLSRSLERALRRAGHKTVYREFREAGHTNIPSQPGFIEATNAFFTKLYDPAQTYAELTPE